MRIPKKAIGIVVVVLVSVVAGFGFADAQDGGPNGSGGAAPAAVAPAAAIGTSEQTFVPVSPCRVADTREAGGILVPGSTRGFEVRGTTGFVPQGGTSGGCGIPDTARAVEITVHSVASQGKGHLRGFPFGGSPSATTVTFPKGIDLSNTGTIPLCLGACAKDLSMRTFLANTHVVLDVTGYYVAPMWASVNTNGSLARGQRVIATTNLPTFTGAYEVIFDRNVTLCAFTATLGNAGIGEPGTGEVTTAQRSGNPNGVFVQTTNSAGSLADLPFYLSVVC